MTLWWRRARTGPDPALTLGEGVYVDIDDSLFLAVLHDVRIVQGRRLERRYTLWDAFHQTTVGECISTTHNGKTKWRYKWPEAEWRDFLGPSPSGSPTPENGPT